MASPSSRITVSEYPDLPTGQGMIEEVPDVSEDEHAGEQGHEEEVSIEGTESNNINTTSVDTPNSVNIIVSGEQVAIDSSTRNTATSKDGTSFTVPACMFDLTSNEPNINTANDIQTTRTAANLSSSFNRAAHGDPKTTGSVKSMSKDEKHAIKQKFKIWIKQKVPSDDEVKIAKYISSLDKDVSVSARQGFMAMSENDRCACTAIVLDWASKTDELAGSIVSAKRRRQLEMMLLQHQATLEDLLGLLDGKTGYQGRQDDLRKQLEEVQRNLISISTSRSTSASGTSSGIRSRFENKWPAG